MAIAILDPELGWVDLGEVPAESAWAPVSGNLGLTVVQTRIEPPRSLPLSIDGRLPKLPGIEADEVLGS